MRKNLETARGREISQFSNQIYFTSYSDLVEKNKQFLILNKQLLNEKNKAEEQEKMKSAFLANIVHEICSPMNSIKGFAELLQCEDLTKEEKIKYAKIISRCSDNLLNLVHDILDFSKIEAGKLSIVERPGNLSELFNEIYELFNLPDIPYHSGTVELKYHLELAPEECLIDADFLRIRQILVNLISNALKFTEKGHVIFGCCLIDPQTLCFTVEDTGIGIAPEQHAVIFEQFRQVNNPESAKRHIGTGLGLSIVKSLVELMNGEIWLDSTVGIGSTFYFTLPYKKSEITESQEEDFSCNWNNKNVLIADNDDFEASLISKHFREAGANCIFTKNGESTSYCIRSSSAIDLVILNSHLADKNGFELLKEIKSINDEIPVIVLVSMESEKEKEFVTNLKLDYVTKPVNMEQLLKIVQVQFNRGNKLTALSRA